MARAHLVDTLRDKELLRMLGDDAVLEIASEAAAEIAHLRDCLGSIRAHLVGQDSALAVAIRATCNAGLRENA